MKIGKIYGRRFYKEHLGLDEGDGTPWQKCGELTEPSDLCTISTDMDTYPTWTGWTETIKEIDGDDCKIQLYLSIDTSDIHPDIIKLMKELFVKVYVPYKYTESILTKHEINCEYLEWASQHRSSKELILPPKIKNPEEIIFMYSDLNDDRTDVVNMAKLFSKILKGTKHFLIIRSNKVDNIITGPNVKFSNELLCNNTMSKVYAICDYIVTFTKAPGVSNDILAAQYFNKPIIAHDKGSFKELKDSSWITLASNEVHPKYTQTKIINKMDINYEKVFYGTWWEIDYEKAEETIRSLIKS